MSRIFISYSRSDKSRVSELETDIEALGNSIWIDNELSGGQAWWNQILVSIRDTDIFVFALTQEGLDSVACEREYK